MEVAFWWMIEEYLDNQLAYSKPRKNSGEVEDDLGKMIVFLGSMSSLFFFNKPDDRGDSATRASFLVFNPSSIVSQTLSISQNFSPTSNMILS